MAMITEEAQRMRIIKRLKDTKNNETVCLWGWEVEVLLKMLEERKGEGCGNTCGRSQRHE